VEVINPEGGKEDAEEEAQKGRWKQEVFIYLFIFNLWLFLVFLYFQLPVEHLKCCWKLLLP